MSEPITPRPTDVEKTGFESILGRPIADSAPTCQSIFVRPNGKKYQCLSNFHLRIWVNPQGIRLTLCPDHYWQVETPASVWTPVDQRHIDGSRVGDDHVQ